MVAQTLIIRGLVLTAIGWVAELVGLAIPYWWFSRQSTNESEAESPRQSTNQTGTETLFGLFKECTEGQGCLSFVMTDSPDWVTGLQGCIIAAVLLLAPGILLPLLHIFIFKQKKYFLLIATAITLVTVALNLAAMITLTLIMVLQKPYGEGFPHAAYFLTCVASVFIVIGSLHFRKAAYTDSDVSSPESGFANPIHSKATTPAKSVVVRKLPPAGTIDRNNLVVVPGTFRTTLNPNTYQDIHLDECVTTEAPVSPSETLSNGILRDVDAKGSAEKKNSVVIVPGTVRATFDATKYKSLNQVQIEVTPADPGSRNSIAIVSDTAGASLDVNSTQDRLQTTRPYSVALDSGVSLRKMLMEALSERRSVNLTDDAKKPTLTSNRNTFPLLDIAHVESETVNPDGIDFHVDVPTKAIESKQNRSSAVVSPNGVARLTTESVSNQRKSQTLGPPPTVMRNSEVIVRPKTVDATVNRNSVTIVPGTYRSTLDPNIYPSLKQVQNSNAQRRVESSEVSADSDASYDSSFSDEATFDDMENNPNSTGSLQQTNEGKEPEATDFVPMLRKNILNSPIFRRSMELLGDSSEAVVMRNKNSGPSGSY